MSIGALAALAERAIKWSAATTAARFALQFTAQVALARILGPDNYGVYGIGLTVLTFVGFLSGTSFSWNLMLLPRIGDDDIRFSFTLQVLAGAACALAMYVAAPALALFFGDPRVEGMVRLLSWLTAYPSGPTLGGVFVKAIVAVAVVLDARPSLTR